LAPIRRSKKKQSPPRWEMKTPTSVERLEKGLIRASQTGELQGPREEKSMQQSHEKGKEYMQKREKRGHRNLQRVEPIPCPKKGEALGLRKEKRTKVAAQSGGERKGDKWRKTLESQGRDKKN